MNDNILFLISKEPTRGQSTLDLILGTDEHLISSINVIEPLSNSDHNSVELAINLENASPRLFKREILDFRKADFDGLRQEIGKMHDWYSDENNVQENWTSFKSKFRNIQKKYIPIKTVNRDKTPHLKWYNLDIERTLKDRNAVYK